MKIVLLGPQRTPTVDRVVRSLEVSGPIATVCAGWQEREPDDDELDKLLGSGTVNLRLFQRWLDVQEHDPAYALDFRRLRRALDELQEFYLVRLDHALRSAYEIQRRGASDDRLRDESLAEAIEAVQDLDVRHLERIGAMEQEFDTTWRSGERPVLREHRDEVAATLRNASACVMTGGHVGVLVELLRRFDVAASLPSIVVAWSAGAMALTDRIVLFHDRSPQGPGQAEVFCAGLGVLPGVVPLPHARSRLMLEDAPRMGIFARRLAPARCVLLESGTRVDIGSDGSCPPNTPVLGENGRVMALEPA